MQTTRGWTGPGWTALTLILSLAVSEVASAASTQSDMQPILMSYKTSGTIDTDTGVSGPTDVVAINFKSVDDGRFYDASAFSLGEFVVAALPQGVVTTYENTPFKISYFATKINGEAPDHNETPITFSGVLNGIVSGESFSNVVATFNPVTSEEFRTGEYLNTISILSPTVSLVPSTTLDGRTTAQAQLTATLSPMPPPIPEPSTWAIFTVAIAGLGIHRRLRSRSA